MKWTEYLEAQDDLEPNDFAAKMVSWAIVYVLFLICVFLVTAVLLVLWPAFLVGLYHRWSDNRRGGFHAEVQRILERVDGPTDHH